MTTTATINVGVSSHYRENSYNSEVTTQGLLGEVVEVIDHQPLFSEITQADGYKSWVSTDQLSFHQQPAENTGCKKLVTSHFIGIFDEPSTNAKRLRDGVIGSTLTVMDEKDNWAQVILPDNTLGWVLQDNLGAPKKLSDHNLIQQAKDFLGYQYIWGGITPKGFDCSGLMQTVFKLCSCALPRDSYQQQQHNLVSHNHNDARPGDLLFFGKTTQKVTHVGLSVGEGRFIHSSGWVKENSLHQQDVDYSEHHLNTFISVNRYLAE